MEGFEIETRAPVLLEQGVESDAPHELRFDRTVWPYLIARTRGTATGLEAGQLIARLDPWIGARTSLLAMWIDGSEQPYPWFDRSALRVMRLWVEVHRRELQDRCIAIAFVSPHVWKRRALERMICHFEVAHRIAVDVFALESSACAWLRAHARLG